MTLKLAVEGLYDVVKYVGSKKDNEDFPFKVEKVLILPTGKTSNELEEIIRLLNSSSSSIGQVLKNEGFGNADVEYFVYSSNGLSNSMFVMPLKRYISLPQ